MASFVEPCNSQIEDCENTRVLVDSGNFNATLILGAIATFKFIFPILMNSTQNTSTSTGLYAYGWSSWQFGNGLVWGFLLLLWPLTYFKISVLTGLYIAVFATAGIIGGYVLALLTTVLFVGAGTDVDADSYIWAGISFLTDLPLVYLTSMFLPDAKAYYEPIYELVSNNKEKVVVDPEVDPKPVDPVDPVKPDEPKPAPKPVDIIPDSPFVDFLVAF